MNVEANIADMRKTDPFGEKWNFDATDALRKKEAENLAAQYNGLKKTEPVSSGTAAKTCSLNRWGLPEDALIEPLGSRGRMMYFLNDGQEFVDCRDTELGSAFIVKLFGEQCNLLWWFFPKYDKKGEIKVNSTDYDATAARNALVRACSLKNKEFGLFDPTRRLRGAGAWTDDDGNLIYHYGDEVVKIRNGHEDHLPCGEIDGYVYAKSETLCKPAPQNCADWKAVADFYRDLQTWNWADSFGAKLFLGWVAESFIGGALWWRGAIWLNGDAASGKSTLTEEVLSGLFGEGLLTTANYTEAAVRQAVGASHLPVALDELEPTANIQRQIALVELARAATSGSKAFRGGQDHNAVGFELKSCFAFSSINLPPLKPQDRQRIAILNLMDLENKDKPDTSVRRLRHVGAVIQRRILNGWNKLKDIVELYREEFERHNAKSRVVDVYGVMLACADLALYGDFDAEHAAQTVDAIYKYIDQVTVEGGTNRSKCVEWLLSFPIREYSGGAMTTVGDLIVCAIGPNVVDAGDARKTLMRYGMKIIDEEVSMRGMSVKVPFLFIANSHKALVDIFMNTDWAGAAGATGGWISALSRMDGAYRAPKNVRCGGWAGRGLIIPLQSLGIGSKEEVL